jgi:Domain of unknown function (DUF222)
MASSSAQEPSEWDEDPAWSRPDPMTPEEREAWLDHLAEADEPLDVEEEEDPEDCAPLTAEELAEVREGAAAGPAVWAGLAGRRGPGQPGSARIYPGESCSPAASFGSGMSLDVMPACPGLALSADAAAGDDDSYTGVSDDELLGMLAAWDRLEAHMAARKLAAAAELIRRSPAPGCEPAGPGRMPEAWDEFAADELAAALAESRVAAEHLLDLAKDLEAKLPGTAGALRDGIISRKKADIIANATALLDEAEARAAEDEVLDRAAQLTPGGLRAAIARAVMEVAPEKAKKRREQAAKDARVERWTEDSGNAALMGRELPPDEVLAADQRITAWAQELKRAGLDGDMDMLRARAYLDVLLGKDSRPQPSTTGGGDSAGPGGSGPGGSDGPGPEGPDAPPPSPGPAGGAVPAGFAGRVTLTAPLATLARLADRPGELAGLGPIDPWLARDLATPAAQNPKTTWCVTVTDKHGHAIGHGCARPEPSSHTKPAGPGPPGFTLTPASRDGPPGRYGTWILHTPGDGPDLRVTLDPIDTRPCDHHYGSQGHDPGVTLRHLTQVRHATCTSPICRRPAAQCDFEHNTPYEAGGRTCLCNGGPKCRHDHRLKQHPKWTVDQLPDGTFRWTTPAGRTYTTEPTRYPI